MSILQGSDVTFDLSVDIAIIGAGGCGLVAALTAHEAGADVLVLERDRVPAGSTALSSGMVPACGTRLQAAHHIADSVACMSDDILAKCNNAADPALVRTLCERSGQTIDWLTETYGIEFQLVRGFLYPGHSVERMHAPTNMTGSALVDALSTACEAAGIDVVCNTTVTALFADSDGTVVGLEATRGDGIREKVGCRMLILACNGFGGNRDMVNQFIPEMADTLYFGHQGNQGDAANWGQALGGELVDMSGYQGHGSVAVPHGILITWALMMGGAIQVNSHGQRFSNEHLGYSEQAAIVAAQPGGLAWNIYDERLHRTGLEFDDYRHAQELGAICKADEADRLADLLGLSAQNLASSIAETRSEGTDRFGRNHDADPPLEAPFYGVKVAGALFHTQGGLRIDDRARVVRAGSHKPLPNLFAGGGAACGVSGPHAEGYLSGNGLLTAIVLGRLAGENAAQACRSKNSARDDDPVMKPAGVGDARNH